MTGLQDLGFMGCDIGAVPALQCRRKGVKARPHHLARSPRYQHCSVLKRQPSPSCLHTLLERRESAPTPFFQPARA